MSDPFEKIAKAVRAQVVVLHLSDTQQGPCKKCGQLFTVSERVLRTTSESDYNRAWSPVLRCTEASE